MWTSIVSRGCGGEVCPKHDIYVNKKYSVYPAMQHASKVQNSYFKKTQAKVVIVFGLFLLTLTLDYVCLKKKLFSGFNWRMLG